MSPQQEIRKQKLIDYINNLDIKIPLFSEQELYNNLCASFEERAKLHKPLTYRGLSKKALNNGYVNMLRHKYSNYDKFLEKIYKKKLPGAKKARILLKNRILDKIAEIYPSLQKTCFYQKIK